MQNVGLCHDQFLSGHQAIYNKKLNSGIFGDCTSESFQIYHDNDFTLLTCDLDLI